MRRTALFLCLLAAVPTFAAAVQGGSIPLPLPLFPPNNWWNIDVSHAPTDLSSGNFISFIGPTRGLHPDFGGDAGGGGVYGVPCIVVDGAQAKKTVTFVEFGSQSDGVGVPFYPVPDEAKTMNGWVEGGQPGSVDQRDDADRHMLMVDKTNNTLYELYHVWWNGSAWEAGSGAFFDMKTNNRRPDTWTSADAAGLAITPGLLRWDEVFGPDEIRHAIRVTVRDTNGYVYPASHSAGSNASALPMGARLRLKETKNISGFAPEIQKIFRAFKKYGLIVADNGSDMYIGGTYDTRWDNDVLNPAFSALKAGDFEVIQRGWKPHFPLGVTLPSCAGGRGRRGEPHGDGVRPELQRRDRLHRHAALHLDGRRRDAADRLHVHRRRCRRAHVRRRPHSAHARRAGHHRRGHADEHRHGDAERRGRAARADERGGHRRHPRPGADQ